MSDIFNEIDEDIRRERYQKLWKSYGKFLILAVVIFFVIAAAYIAWNNYLENMLVFSESDYSAANNELKLIQMRNLMLEGINEENLHLFEIKSEKVIKKDFETNKIITIIFLLSFVLYSLFIVTFR